MIRGIGLKYCRRCAIKIRGYKKGKKTESQYNKLAKKHNIYYIGPHPNTTNDNTFWQCKCKNKIFKSYLQIRNKQICCKECQQKNRAQAHFSGYGEIGITYWNTIKMRALKKQMDFQMTIKDANDLYIAQNKKCALSGIEITLGEMGKRTKVRFTASLDRIDSQKGYIIGNIQWVHKDINRMKSHYDQNYFISICKQIAQNNV